MSKAIIFPGQGSQTPGMGKQLFAESPTARERFQSANDILGFEITKIMFEGSAEDLTRTSVTQPAIFLHSVILAEVLNLQSTAQMTAGHSLGEFSALVFSGSLTFENGLRLVYERAEAMQEACDLTPSTMAAIVGLADEAVEEICAAIDDIVVPANYNSQGQLVISGSIDGVEKALIFAKEKGAKIAKRIPVNGAFHSPFMQPAQDRLARAIEATALKEPLFPIYQNCSASAERDPAKIKENLKKQLTAPVRWTQSIRQMIADGATFFEEIGPGKVLQGLVKRIDASVQAESRS
jgi:[acyl-carrier-protein] S-malonyltransferase